MAHNEMAEFPLSQCLYEILTCKNERWEVAEWTA